MNKHFLWDGHLARPFGLRGRQDAYPTRTIQGIVRDYATSEEGTLLVNARTTLVTIVNPTPSAKVMIDSGWN